jgi:hypothetical protein
MRLNEVADQSPVDKVAEEAKALAAQIFDAVEAVMVKGNPLEAIGTLRVSLRTSSIPQVSSEMPWYHLLLRIALPQEAGKIDRDVLNIQLRRLINRLTRPMSIGGFMDRIEPGDNAIIVGPAHGAPSHARVSLKVVPKGSEDPKAWADHVVFMTWLDETPEKVWDIERSRA